MEGYYEEEKEIAATMAAKLTHTVKDFAFAAPNGVAALTT